MRLAAAWAGAQATYAVARATPLPLRPLAPGFRAPGIRAPGFR